MIVNLLLQLLDERGVLLLLLGGHHQSLLARRQLLPGPLCLLAASLGEGDSEVECFFFRFAGTLDLELVVSIYH